MNQIEDGKQFQAEYEKISEEVSFSLSSFLHSHPLISFPLSAKVFYRSFQEKTAKLGLQSEKLISLRMDLSTKVFFPFLLIFPLFFWLFVLFYFV